MSQNLSNLLYLVTIICFILALRFLSSPTTARHGNWVGAAGMTVAIIVTLAQPGVDITWQIVVGGALVIAAGATVVFLEPEDAAAPEVVPLGSRS